MGSSEELVVAESGEDLPESSRSHCLQSTKSGNQTYKAFFPQPRAEDGALFDSRS